MKFADALSKREIEFPRSYLYMIGLNLVRNRGRQKPTVSLDEVGDLPDEDAPMPEIDREVEQEKLQRAMERLAEKKPAFYDVLHLRIFEELSFDDVAELLKRNRNTVTAQYRYALGHMKGYIEEIND